MKDLDILPCFDFVAAGASVFHKCMSSLHISFNTWRRRYIYIINLPCNIQTTIKSAIDEGKIQRL